MKICIVTFYKSDNSGTFWQAKILGKAIERLGHQVCYFDTKSTTMSTVEKFLAFGKMLFLPAHNKTVKIMKDFKSKKRFYECRKELKIIPNNPQIIKDIDCFVLGSDTIWNLDGKRIEQKIKLMWGNQFDGKKVITYAGSVANTSKEKFSQFPQLPSYIQKWKRISVRDSHTFEILSSVTDKPIEIVCDPTLLFDKNDYQKMLSDPSKEKYIFLYLFKKLSSDQQEQLRSFADEQGLKIIQGTHGNRNSTFYDEMSINEPYAFLNNMFYASYVITDTFHGAVFSTNLEKKFVAMERGKNKVNDFLKSVGLENRLVCGGQDLLSTLTKDIDYEVVNQAVASMRERSYQYLKSAIES